MPLLKKFETFHFENGLNPILELLEEQGNISNLTITDLEYEEDNDHFIIDKDLINAFLINQSEYTIQDNSTRIIGMVKVFLT